jgi:hypothetical protein
MDARRGNVVTRLLTDESVRGSAYAVAFIAAELLGLSEQLAAAHDASPDAALDAQDTHAAADDRALRLALGVAAEWTHYPGSGLQLWRPALELWLPLGARGERMAPWLGLRASVFGDWSRGAGAQAIELAQHDLDLRAGLAYRMGDSTLLAAAGLGAQWVGVQLAGEPGGTTRSLLARLGVGLQARHRIAESLAFFAAVEGLLTPVATRYEARGEEVLAPARLGLSAGLGLSWDNSR